MTNSGARSDEELMILYQKGDSLAFDELYERHAGKVFGYLSKRNFSKLEAGDLVQEVFLKLHRSKHLYNHEQPFLPWLFIIARTTLLDFAKKKRLTDEPLEDHDEISSDKDQDNPESHEWIEDQLQKLPVQQKTAMVLRFYEESEFEEIARKLQTSPENARQLVSRGLRSLKDLVLKKKGTKE